MQTRSLLTLRWGEHTHSAAYPEGPHSSSSQCHPAAVAGQEQLPQLGMVLGHGGTALVLLPSTGTVPPTDPHHHCLCISRLHLLPDQLLSHP